jgi:hypothetical protein
MLTDAPLVAAPQTWRLNWQCHASIATQRIKRKMKKDVNKKEVSRLKIKSSQKLPKKLPSAVCAQFVRCGKPTCRCALGRPHGPYFYCFWREGRKLKKAYIKKADVDRVRNLCQASRLTRQILNINFELWQSLQHELREVESYARTNRA